MPSKKNIASLEELKTKLNKAKSVILADYRGLKVNKLNELRQKISVAGGELKVYKNTLLNISLKDIPSFSSKLLFDTPTVIVFSNVDEITALKALYQFTLDNELPKIKFGVMDDRFIEKQDVIALAKLPGKLELQGKLVGILQSPIHGLVYVLKGNLDKLVRVLEQIRNSKS